MGKSYHLKEQKISYKKNAFLEDHGGGEDIPMLDPGLMGLDLSNFATKFLIPNKCLW